MPTETETDLTQTNETETEPNTTSTRMTEPPTGEDRALVDALRELQESRAEVARLAPLADQGTAYRDELVARTVVQGKRAFGVAFPEETYRALLGRATFDEIKAMADAFKGQADARVPTGARVDATATDDHSTTLGTAHTNGAAIPDSAYRVR